jgi:hypothetical protein
VKELQNTNKAIKEKLQEEKCIEVERKREVKEKARADKAAKDEQDKAEKEKNNRQNAL